MPSVSLQQLLEAGTHFGHQTKRWNPKMKRFILCARNGIYIVDLNKTISGLETFIARVREEVAKGGKVLFVGTKKQIKDCIREEAERVDMPYVTERWLGGMLTNFQTIRQSIRKLEKIEKMEADGIFTSLTKKEVLTLNKKREKLQSILGGIRHLRKLPALIFVVDVIKEHIAIEEARTLSIPIGAIVDTNCDPDNITYPIPGNDDAIKSIQIITRAVADAILSTTEKAAIKAEDMDEKAKPDGTMIKHDSEIQEILEASEEGITPAAVVPGIAGDNTNPARQHRVIRKKIAKPADEE